MAVNLNGGSKSVIKLNLRIVGRVGIPEHGISGDNFSNPSGGKFSVLILKGGDGGFESFLIHNIWKSGVEILILSSDSRMAEASVMASSRESLSP